MGKESEPAAEIFDSSTLIDFLYVDTHRVDSLISQLRSGTLRSVAKTTGASEGYSLSAKADVAITGGSYGKRSNSGSRATEQYDPYHSQIIQLLNDLNLPSVEHLPEKCTGQLVMLKAPIRIRDIATMKAVLPVMAKNQGAMQLPKSKEFKTLFSFMLDLIQQMSDSIIFTASLDGKQIAGTLKPDGLSIKQDDLMRTYGVALPDTWQTLGILDTVERLDEAPDITSIEGFTDMVSSAMNTLYTASKYKLIPLLIFRGIRY